jgi:predicted amidohydrolase
VVVAAQKDGSTLALFPEYSSALEAGALTAQTATVTRDGEWVSALRELTAETGVTVVVGALVLPPGAPRPRNTMLAVSGGNIVASAEKLHLYDAFGAQESAVISAGEIGPCELFDWAGMKVGMMACYDLRFPEVARRLVDAGAHALVVPAQWMAGPNKDVHWETLLRARAIENQMWVMGVNQPGPHATGDVPGHRSHRQECSGPRGGRGDRFLRAGCLACGAHARGKPDGLGAKVWGNPEGLEAHGGSNRGVQRRRPRVEGLFARCGVFNFRVKREAQHAHQGFHDFTEVFVRGGQRQPAGHDRDR